MKADGDLGKDDVSLHLALGEALSRAGAHAEAAQHLQQALDLCYEHELGDKVYGAVEYNLAVATEDAAGEQAAARAEELYRDLTLTLALALALALALTLTLTLTLTLSRRSAARSRADAYPRRCSHRCSTRYPWRCLTP